MNLKHCILFVFIILVERGKCDSSQKKDLNFTELAKFDGYDSEVHSVTTEDGYILTLHRIPAKNCTNKIPIVFMHGLYLSSDDCIIAGPGVAHCYVYADNCYDVWAPNSRGNFYSRKHETLNPDKDSEYWNYDIDEMASYDLPAILDYILEITEQSQVAYIAHSQGASILLMLCAKNEAYNSKIKVAFGLSTTAWLNNARFVVIELEKLISPLLTTAGSAGVHMEVLARGSIGQTSIKTLCGSSVTTYPLCSGILFAALGYNKYQITENALMVAAAHNPSGTSLKTFNRWGQMKKNGFTEFDYGSIQNLAKYGQIQPPEIDLSGVTARWIFIGSENDYVSDLRDLDTLVSKLKNVEVCIVSDTSFAHLDFVYGKDIPKYISPIVLSTLESGSFECL